MIKVDFIKSSFYSCLDKADKISKDSKNIRDIAEIAIATIQIAWDYEWIPKDPLIVTASEVFETCTLIYRATFKPVLIVGVCVDVKKLSCRDKFLETLSKVVKSVNDLFKSAEAWEALGLVSQNVWVMVGLGSFVPYIPIIMTMSSLTRSVIKSIQAWKDTEKKHKTHLNGLIKKKMDVLIMETNPDKKTLIAINNFHELKVSVQNIRSKKKPPQHVIDEEGHSQEVSDGQPSERTSSESLSEIPIDDQVGNSEKKGKLLANWDALCIEYLNKEVTNENCIDKKCIDEESLNQTILACSNWIHESEKHLDDPVVVLAKESVEFALIALLMKHPDKRAALMLDVLIKGKENRIYRDHHKHLYLLANGILDFTAIVMMSYADQTFKIFKTYSYIKKCVRLINHYSVNQKDEKLPKISYTQIKEL